MIRIAVFALVLLIVIGIPSDAEEPFAVETSIAPTVFLPGEPITLEVAARNVSGKPVVVGFSRPPFAIRIHEHGGERRDDCGLCQSRWGLVRNELPVDWEHRETLQMYLEETGTYDIRVVLRKHWNVEHRPPEFMDIWWGECVSPKVEIRVERPTGVDRDAYEAFDGHPLKGGRSGYGARLLQEFPTSKYAGYILAKELSPLPGVGDDPKDRVMQLTDAGFFLRFPTTHDRSKDAPEGSRLDMETVVRNGARLRREFLDAHPDFPLRTDLERQLGDFELVLGNYERAYQAWAWVADHATANLTSWAEGTVQAMESQELVEPRGGTDE